MTSTNPIEASANSLVSPIDIIHITNVDIDGGTWSAELEIEVNSNSEEPLDYIFIRNLKDSTSLSEAKSFERGRWARDFGQNTGLIRILFLSLTFPVFPLTNSGLVSIT